MKHNTHGGGTKPAENGLGFEAQKTPKDLLVGSGFLLDGDVLMKDGVSVGLFLGKHKFYSFLSEHGVNWKDYVSRRLLPDEAFLNFEKKELTVIEKKYQERAGSVDEKLQTADFKKKQYEKLLAPLGIKVRYAYVLNDWFKKKEYKDTLEYIERVGCEYYFDEIPKENLI